MTILYTAGIIYLFVALITFIFLQYNSLFAVVKTKTLILSAICWPLAILTLISEHGR